MNTNTTTQHVRKYATTAAKAVMRKMQMKTRLGSILKVAASLFLASAATSLDAAIFTENFNGYAGIQNNMQYQTGLKVSHTGSLPAWNRAGSGTAHAVDLNTNGNYAVMLWKDNVITLASGIAANDAGVGYTVAFSAGPATYNEGTQATGISDSMLFEVLRGDNSVLAFYVCQPGAWVNRANTNSLTLTPYNFSYAGDGSGPVRIRISPLVTANRFAGAVDDLSVTSTGPAPAKLGSLSGDFTYAENTTNSLWSFRMDEFVANPTFLPLLNDTSRNATTLWGPAFATPPLLWSEGGGYWGIGKNNTGVAQAANGVAWAPNEVLLHPKGADVSRGLVICWKAPRKAVVNVRYSFRRGMDAGTGVGYELRTRIGGVDTILVDFTNIGNGVTRDQPIVAFNAGDQLFFRIDSWGAASGDVTGAAIEITECPLLTLPVSWNLNSITNGVLNLATQYQTANNLRAGPTVPGWTVIGPCHAVERGAGTGDWAPMFYRDFVLKQPVSILANETGKVYRVAFDVGPAVYSIAAQATASNDWLRVNVVSSNNVTVGTYSSKPGYWAGAETLHADSFLYAGDGSGPVYLSFSGNNPGLAHFQGAIDNVSVALVATNIMPFKLGFTADGTGTGGWTGYHGINNVDGSPDGYSWDIDTLVTVATGSSLLGSDRIVAGEYTISFLAALTPLWATAPTKSLTVTAKDTLGHTLGSKTVELGQGSWNRETLTFTVSPYSASYGAYLVLEFTADITDSTAIKPWHGLDSITAFVSPIPVKKGTFISFW